MKVWVEHVLSCNVNVHFFLLSEEDDWNLASIAIQTLAAKWRDIGKALGISPAKLDEIAVNNSQAGDRLSKVLQCWIGQNYNTTKFGLPSWRTLCKGISQAADKKFVKDLAKVHPLGGT